MQLPPKHYDEMVRRASPPSPLLRDCLWAFFVGGGICLLGELLRMTYCRWLDEEAAGTLTSITLVFLSAVATLPGWYHKLATHAGAGTLVPITGFANSVVSPALEFKAEGWVTGVGARIFSIAGPVLAYGTFASWIWGILYWVLLQLGMA
ncbi:MAG: SpoVA/SpoVAEb family sporulation membrane protein [Gemmiger sp.]|uniref:SpoVA/SpoVAEb family sporulation membrane protein n=1 Tax=Gemmiger sp. TaxID=2049027 RepID=UPI002E77A223|nr:SpoVA/SpoVAEb family sporulation membrane protein [Gemmiger sp.]MEE0801032.1 SpoVA/SpoVAEb family sporulation membrane protein [Gemmiger sp.]